MNFGSRSLSFSAVPLSLLWQPRIISQVPYSPQSIHFTRFVLWISKFDFMLFLHHNNPGLSFAQGIISTWFNSAQFLCPKVQMVFCSPTHQKHTYFPPPQLRRFRSLSNLSIPTFHQLQPVVISIILACFLLAHNTSLLILRIRFQSILRIFLPKHPIRQEIPFFIYCPFQFFNKASFPLTEN